MHNMLTASPAYMECVSEDTSSAFLWLVDMYSRRCLIGKEICCCWRVLESPFPRAVNSEGVGEGEGHPQISTIGHHVASPCRATYIWGFCIEFLHFVMLLCPAYILYSWYYVGKREGKLIEELCTWYALKCRVPSLTCMAQLKSQCMCNLLSTLCPLFHDRELATVMWC